VQSIEMGQTLNVRVELTSPDERPPVALIGVVRADGTPVYGVASDHEQHELRPLDERRYGTTLEFPDLNLLPGGYAIRVHAMDPEGLRLHDTVELELSVRGRSRALGLVRLPHRWRPPEG
jgi:lipopolysaccharide transport system ATP-binding protein